MESTRRRRSTLNLLWREYEMGMHIRTGLGLVLVLLVGLSGAPTIDAQEKAMTDSSKAALVDGAKLAAQAWLEVVDAAEYGKSWDAAASMFKAAVTKEQWEAAVVQARGPFEPMGGRELLGARYMTELPGAPKGEYVVMQYEIRASDNTRLIETITPMLDSDGEWRVSGYFVQRP
jgi:hypothetical protein